MTALTCSRDTKAIAIGLPGVYVEDLDAPLVTTESFVLFHIARTLQWKVKFEGREFHLRKPLSVKETFENRLWTHECDELGILAYGHTEDESKRAFAMEFASCWDHIATEADNNLTTDAKDLKRQILDFVQRVETTS